MAANSRRGRRGSPERGGAAFADTVADPTIVQRLNRILAVGALVGLAVAGFLWIRPSLAHQKVLDAEISALEEARRKAEAIRDAARTELDWVRYDPAYLELLARDRLGLHRPGETILHIDRDGR